MSEHRLDYTVSPQMVEKIAELSKLEIPSAHKEQMREEMEEMLHFMNRVAAYEEGSQPYNPKGCSMPTREDIITNGNRRDELLQNAKQVKEACIVVPRSI